MVLTCNKFGLHFTDPNAKIGYAKDQTEATSRHKDQVGKDTDLDASTENISDDADVDLQETSKDDPQDMLKDNHQDKPTEGSAGGKGTPEKSDLVVAMGKSSS
uniref:Uncharacterized protein n=1 Tax=Cannabis sativa TaxID=3483 RepID=A0A803QGU2_CANSA